MSVIKRMRRQRAVYWERSAPDRFGKFTYADPVEIKCRWDDHIGVTRDEKGELRTSKATVYPDREMKIGDKLMKGEMDSNTMDDPRNNSTAFEIIGFEINPNYRNTENFYTAHL